MLRMARLCALFLLLSFMPGTALAQQDPNAGHGDGTPADQSTTDAAIAFVTMFVDGMNARDPAIVNVANASGLGFFLTDSYDEAVANVVNGRFIEIVLYDAGAVLTHPDGAVSARVTYSGYTPGFAQTLLSERWFFMFGADGGLILDSFAHMPVQVPESMTVANVELTLANDGLVLSPSDVPAADVTIFHVSSAEPNWTTTGIYTATEYADPTELQSALSADPYTTRGYHGKTPTPPNTVDLTFGFLLPPGTYFIQQFTLDPTGFTITGVPQGDAAVTTLVISASATATPAG